MAAVSARDAAPLRQSSLNNYIRKNGIALGDAVFILCLWQSYQRLSEFVIAFLKRYVTMQLLEIF